jgi:hypothetical protein
VDAEINNLQGFKLELIRIESNYVGRKDSLN